ncbi:lytic murein transglycosylase [Mesorhizobium sp. M6A.T.Ca.TU.002.02.2.1]|nr:lytic murein transglycosylase [Mesorhizobium sp. M6A.T.Ca.TU.002.02.2.1]
MFAFLPTPLCPALFAKTWHLPSKGGDSLRSLTSPIATVANVARLGKLPISPLAGEMPGRAEGGVHAQT